MTRPEDVAAFLIETYWSRSATEPESIAMSGEIVRDSAWVATINPAVENGCFSLEPSHYTALMLRETGQ